MFRIFTEKAKKAFNKVEKKIETYDGSEVTIMRGPRGFGMMVDGSWQVAEGEHGYHEALGQIPLVIAPSIETVAIIGGSDGLLTAQVLKFKEVKVVNQVGEDLNLLQMGMTNPDLRRLNNDSLWDNRVVVYRQRVIKFLYTHNNEHDVVIIDFPVARQKQYDLIKQKGFYDLVKKTMTPTGVIAVQVSTYPNEIADAVWSIGKAWKHVLTVTFKNKDLLYTFVFGSDTPFKQYRSVQQTVDLNDDYIQKWISEGTSALSDVGETDSTPPETPTIGALRTQIAAIKDEMAQVDSAIIAVNTIMARVRDQKRE